MKPHNRLAFLGLVLACTLLANALFPIPALAEDGTPPPPTEEPAPPPEGDPIEDPAAAPPDESAAEDSNTTGTADTEPVEETPTPEPAPDPAEEIPPVDEPAADEVLEDLPQGAEVVVLDEGGNAEPLASEQAARIISESDPIWCPAGQTPGSDLDDASQDCTDSYATVTELVDNLGSKSGAGTIYFTPTYTDSDAVFDHTHANLGALTDLTIQGGWNGDLGGTYALSGVTTFNGVPLTISNWVGNVTLNDIAVLSSAGGLDVQTAGSVNLFEVSAHDTADDAGITIDAGGDVTAEEVAAHDNDLEGMHLTAGGDVSVEDSEFEDNGWGGWEVDDDGYYESLGASGLYVDSGGDVTLDDVDAEENAMHGVEIYAGGAVGITEGSFEENGWYGFYSENTLDLESQFSETIYSHGGSGVFVESLGDITLEDVYAGYNANFGAILNSQGGGVGVFDSEFYENGGLGSLYSSVNLEEYSEDVHDYSFAFDYHAGGGFLVEADGDVTISDVYAYYNAGDGGIIDESQGDVQVLDSVFEENGWWSAVFDCSGEFCECDGEDCWGYELIWEGLEEYCDESGLGGLFFDPCTSEWEVFAPNFHLDLDETASEDHAEGGYSMEQYGGTGLYVEAGDDILLENTQAVYNSGAGADLDADGDITVLGGDEEEDGFNGNGLLGNLFLGEILAIETLEEGEHQEYGLYFNSAYDDGLYADSDGNLTLDEVHAYGNGGDGADLGAEGAVLVQDSLFEENGDEELCNFILCEFGIYLPASSLFVELYAASDSDGEGGFTNQALELYAGLGSGSGLEVDEADGGVTLNGVTAVYNGGYGAELDTAANAFIADSGFEENGYGMQGFLELDADLDFSECEGFFCLEGITPTYLDGYFSSHSGLAVYAEGDVTLEQVTAAGNSLHGAELYSQATDSVAVNTSLFEGNGFGMPSVSLFLEADEDPETDDIPGFEEQYGSGLYIESQGRVTLVEVQAIGNYNQGAEVYSNNKRVIVSCGEYSYNGQYGILAEGASSLELYGPHFEGNGMGDYFFGGSVVQSDDCTIPEDGDGGGGGETLIIPVTGGEQITCEGSAASVTVLLPNGDFVILPCPINEYGVVDPLPSEGLPGGPGEGFEFLSALTAVVIREGQAVEELDQAMVVSFRIPPGVDPGDLAILFWNGNEWVELEGELSEDGLHFEVTTRFTGTFMLVMQ